MKDTADSGSSVDGMRVHAQRDQYSADQPVVAPVGQPSAPS